MSKRRKSVINRIFPYVLLLAIAFLIGRYSLFQEPWVYPEHPHSYDVVVISNSLAGAAAALTAAENGADVFYLELKDSGFMEFPSFSPAFWASATMTQAEQEVMYSPEDMAQEIFLAGKEKGNYKQILRLSQESAEALLWLEQVTGVIFSKLYNPQLSPGLHLPVVGQAENFVFSSIQKGLERLLSGYSRDLLPQRIIMEKGRVAGIILKDGDEEIEFRCKAIILANGEDSYGVGINMAVAAGAKTEDRGHTPKFPVYSPSGARVVEVNFPGALLISKTGEPLSSDGSLSAIISAGGGKIYVLADSSKYYLNDNFVYFENLSSLAVEYGLDEEDLLQIAIELLPPYYVAVLELASVPTGKLQVDEEYRVLGGDGEVSGLFATEIFTVGLHGQSAILDLVLSEMITGGRLSGIGAAKQALR